MKPNGRARFPATDRHFHSGFDAWRGSWDSDDDRERRDLHRMTREFMAECARERMREMYVFGVVLLVSAWPVIYMVVTVVHLLRKGRPLDV